MQQSRILSAPLLLPLLLLKPHFQCIAILECTPILEKQWGASVNALQYFTIPSSQCTPILEKHWTASVSELSGREVELQ